MFSLTSRILIAGTIVLSAFFGLTGYTLDNAYQKSAKKAVENRLLGQVMTLIAVAQVNLDGTIQIPANLPFILFNNIDSPYYGKILDAKGNVIWTSPYMGSRDFKALQLHQITQTVLTRTKDSLGSPIFNLSYCITWDTVNNKPVYTINIAESTENYNTEIAHFRKILWSWLIGVSIVLLITFWTVIRWSLRPLRQAAEEIVSIEQGKKTKIEGTYPTELKALTANLNALIKSNHEHLVRHRNALSDLAHSLKTPLALMRSASQSYTDGNSQLNQAIGQQTNHMQQIIDYQLQRAATSGRIPLAKPISVEGIVTKIVSTMSKVYAGKKVNCVVQIDKPCLFLGDESDLFEILGNLIDNAYKWCKKSVRITARVNESCKTDRCFTLIVEDDGPGIDKEIAENVTERGVKSSRKPGTGIGLAIVEDIVDAYQGEFQIGKSQLGGACFELRFAQST